MALSSTVKDAIVLKALNRGPGVTLKSIAKTNNIGLSTLNKWLTQSRKSNCTKMKNDTAREQWLNHLLNTNGMDDVSLGIYCRKHGIYSHQLTEWKKELMTPKHDNNNNQNQEVKKLQEENKKLQREIKRKDKALAEASALLILKKKANLIWGVDEDD